MSVTPKSACAGRVIPLRPGRPCPCYPGLALGRQIAVTYDIPVRCRDDFDGRPAAPTACASLWPSIEPGVSTSVKTTRYVAPGLKQADRLVGVGGLQNSNPVSSTVDRRGF